LTNPLKPSRIKPLMTNKSFLTQILFFVVFLLHSICFAQTPPASQQMSGEERSRQMQEES